MNTDAKLQNRKPVKLRHKERFLTTNTDVFTGSDTSNETQSSAIYELAHAINSDGKKTSSHVGEIFDEFLQKKIAEIEHEQNRIAECDHKSIVDLAKDSESMDIIALNTEHNELSKKTCDKIIHSSETFSDTESNGVHNVVRLSKQKHKKHKHKNNKKKHKHKDKHQKKDKKRAGCSSVEYDESFWGDYKRDEHTNKKRKYSTSSNEDTCRNMDNDQKHRSKKNDKKSHRSCTKEYDKHRKEKSHDHIERYKDLTGIDNEANISHLGREDRLSIDRLSSDKEDKLIEERLLRAKRAAAERKKKFTNDYSIPLLTSIKSEPLVPKNKVGTKSENGDSMCEGYSMLALPVRKKVEGKDEENIIVPMAKKGNSGCK